MDIIFPEYEEFHTKVVFYRIPKNASTSIYGHLGRANLIENYIDKLQEKTDKNIYNKIHPSHIKPDEFKDLVLGEELKNFFSFSSVRNPWDRAVSLYFSISKNKEIKEDIKRYYNINKDLSFSLFCSILFERKDDPYFIASHNQVLWTQGKYPPKRILRFENINDEFSNMVKDYNLVTVSQALPHKNKTKHTHYSDYYNTETKKLIAEIFEEDIDTFNYSFNQKDADFPKPKEQQGFLRI